MLFVFSNRSFDDFKCFGHFVLQIGKLCGQQRPLGIDHDIDGKLSLRAIQSDRFTQTPFRSIALNRPAKRFADREPYAEPAITTPARQVKHRHVLRKLAASLFIHSLKIRMLEQAMNLGKALAGCRHSGIFQFWLQASGLQAVMMCTCPKAGRRTPEAVLLTKSWFYGNPLAAFGPAAGDDRASLLGLHTSAKAVHLGTAAAIRLECTFRHGKWCAPVVSNCAASK